jgi:sec-independent protein translocase protein TatA
MFGLGIAEAAVILVLALIVFGPRRLPELGRGLGQAITEFKRGAAALAAKVDEAGK